MIKGEAEVTSTVGNDSTVTHQGITYTITHNAHQSETPLETCHRCGGSGQLYTRKCRHCDGRGILIEPRG